MRVYALVEYNLLNKYIYITFRYVTGEKSYTKLEKCFVPDNIWRIGRFCRDMPDASIGRSENKISISEYKERRFVYIYS